MKLSGSWKNDSQSFITNYGNGTPFQIVYQDWDDVNLTWKNDLKTTLTYTSLAVEEHVFEKTFVVYPNPAQDKVTIKTNGSSVGMKYLLTDQLGRQFLNGTINDNETIIDVSQLTTGDFIKMGQNNNQTIKMLKK